MFSQTETRLPSQPIELTSPPIVISAISVFPFCFILLMMFCR